MDTYKIWEQLQNAVPLFNLDHLFYMHKYGKTGVQGLGWRLVYYKTGREFLHWKKNGKKSKCTTQVSKKESQRDLELLFSHGTFFCMIAKEIKTAK